MNESWLQDAIDRQRAGLSARLCEPFARIAERCGECWRDSDALDAALASALAAVAPCHLLYALDAAGMQISANIVADGTDPRARGQDLSGRPYLGRASPNDFTLQLSDVYVCRITARPCVTAVQPVTVMGRTLGYVAADFALRELPAIGLQPLATATAAHAAHARQIKGDPAIRETVFAQRRVESDMDRRMSELLAIMDELLGERGVFHAKLHFSSSRATLWLTDDPFRYRVHVLNEIVEPAVCLAYPPRPYPEQAVVSRAAIGAVFERLALLRNLDDTFYLRSGSLNVINGMVGLTFSCDGTYYLHADEFLARDQRFWLGA